MAKYEISHSCGHTEIVRAHGSADERERRLSWLSNQPCFRCRCAVDSAEAIIHAAVEGLPALTGTPKQVGWAERIRHQLLAGLKKERLRFEAEARADLLNGDISPKTYDDALSAFDFALDKVYKMVDASWWIDHRDLSPRMLIWEVTHR